jgi:hypothetical protein
MYFVNLISVHIESGSCHNVTSLRFAIVGANVSPALFVIVPVNFTGVEKIICFRRGIPIDLYFLTAALDVQYSALTMIYCNCLSILNIFVSSL